NSSDSENEERIETESENEEKETGIENEEIGSEDKETGIENEETGIENEEIGSEDKEIGSEDKETESEDKETGIENEETGIENEEIGSEEKETETHVQKNNIKYNEAFFKFSNTIGPCRPLFQFPTNQDGRSFQGHWYDETPWLEYSPQSDALYCFSCRMFLNDDKYKTTSTWKSRGVNRWRQAKRHAACVETQKAINPGQRPLELQKLSDTRWTCRENALKTIRKVLPAAMQYLEDLRKCEPPDLAAGDAKILLRSINFEFLLCLEITTPVFLETSMASNALKDLAAAYTVVDGVLRRVQELRTDEQFTEIVMKATTAAEALDIEIPEQIPGQGRRQKVPEKFKYSSTSANEDHHVLTLEEYYGGKLYFTFLDILRQELERRFR
ncbi:hypothetical protein KUCAC02_019913, partial [Chaenocephalus aceratus]